MSVSINPGGAVVRGPRNALVAALIVLAAILVAAWLSADRGPVEVEPPVGVEAPVDEPTRRALDATAPALPASATYPDPAARVPAASIASPAAVAPAPFTGFHVDEAGVIYGYEPLRMNHCALIPTTVVGVPEPC